MDEATLFVCFRLHFLKYAPLIFHEVVEAAIEKGVIALAEVDKELPLIDEGDTALSLQNERRHSLTFDYSLCYEQCTSIVKINQSSYLS